MQLCPGKDASYDANGSVKGPMLLEILRATSVGPSDALFFDDQEGNIRTGNQLGLNAQKCNKAHKGLTEGEFLSGLSQMDGSPHLVIFDIDFTLTRPRREEDYTAGVPGIGEEVIPYLVSSMLLYLAVVVLYREQDIGEFPF